ncbi:uncharacterized protein EKO05_0011184 [Ascochyta rabiei]|uniref:uncharacterized protein n=1 Tax=Didymella rabiei TaxID=5454 RepID=UPI0021FE9AAA|nr:uncharacterized protein EKO05_0011184 [Ascochyta rabiei]UPX20978.1 hypothetical protein EKO05_0011184 [Ascochyta rabiei]
MCTYKGTKDGAGTLHSRKDARAHHRRENGGQGTESRKGRTRPRRPGQARTAETQSPDGRPQVHEIEDRHRHLPEAARRNGQDAKPPLTTSCPGIRAGPQKATRHSHPGSNKPWADSGPSARTSGLASRTSARTTTRTPTWPFSTPNPSSAQASPSPRPACVRGRQPRG